MIRHTLFLHVSANEWKPDLILASGDRMICLASWVAGEKFSWVAVEHGRTPVKWEQRIKRWALRRASAVICVSEYTRTQMLKMGAQPRKSCTIPNGADDTQFKLLPAEDVKRFSLRLGLEDAKILLTVGHVSERKGQDIVIRVLPFILKQIPNVHYCLAGLPTEKDKLQKLAAELGVTEHVHFIGRLDSETLVCALNACDVFVMTSRHASNGSFEGYGIAVVEAALCGKPAVVSNNSGLAEAIAEGETGFGVPENNEIATANAILKLLQDDGLRLRMGEAARARALAEQTWESRAKEYNKLLRSLL